jgi:hypothetical protein
MRIKSKPYKGRTPAKPKLTLAVGRIYLVKRYYTGDFRARCCDSLERSVRLKVTDPMKSATLKVDDEIEIPFVHAEFIPAIVEKFRSAEFERERVRESG